MEVLSTGVGAQRNFEVGAEVQPELSCVGMTWRFGLRLDLGLLEG